MSSEPLYSLEVIQTNTKTWKFTVTQGPLSSPTPLNLTGYVLFFTVKLKSTDSDSDALINITIDLPNNSDTTNGICYLALTSENTNIPIGQYVYDVKIQLSASGGAIIDRRTIGTGTFLVNLTVTQRTN